MKSKPHYLFIAGTSEPGGVHVHTADVTAALSAAGHRTTILYASVDHFSSICSGTGVKVEVIPPRRHNASPLNYWRRPPESSEMFSAGRAEAAIRSSSCER